MSSGTFVLLYYWPPRLGLRSNGTEYYFISVYTMHVCILDEKFAAEN